MDFCCRLIESSQIGVNDGVVKGGVTHSNSGRFSSAVSAGMRSSGTLSESWSADLVSSGHDREHEIQIGPQLVRGALRRDVRPRSCCDAVQGPRA